MPDPDLPPTPPLPSDIADVLDALVRVVERQSTQFRASILLLSPDGQHLLDVAGPSLPAEYRRRIHGQRIGEAAGSCGTAAYRNERVVVTDIENDPLWADYRDLIRPFGFASCWSHPIRSSAGAVLGTFAMYYDLPHTPDTRDLQIIATAAARAGVLIEQALAGVPHDELVAAVR